MTGVHQSIGTDAVANAPVSGDPWVPLWPNPADVPYNYLNLLDLTKTVGIANVTGQSVATKNIAIVGAGYAGLTVARETATSSSTPTCTTSSTRTSPIPRRSRRRSS